MTQIEVPKRVRMATADRRNSILAEALNLSEQIGFSNVTSVKLSQALGGGHAIIFHYFPTMDLLRAAVMALAIEQGNVKVLLDGLTCRHPVALDAPEKLKDQARSLLD